jgi:hypothetical protein
MANLVDQAPAMAGMRQRSVRWWALAGVLAALGGVGGVAFLDTEQSLATQDVRLRLALAAPRYGSLPRWLGWLSAVVGTLVAVAVIAGAPEAGYLPGAAWLLITSLTLARQRKA